MISTDRLIVALDIEFDNCEWFTDAYGLPRFAHRLRHEAGINFFKFGIGTLTQESGLRCIRNCVAKGIDVFLDLKLYDTRDTVDVTVRRAFDLGARFITVHATPSVMEAAMRAKPADPRAKVLAVSVTTDQGDSAISPYAHEQLVRSLKICDGVVCSHKLAFHARRDKKISVCPAIRPNPPSFTACPDYLGDGGHSYPATPSVALSSGADYLVVGRPITQAPDPVAAARAIIAEMVAV